MSKYLKEMPHEEAMEHWGNGANTEPLTHSVWTFDFMCMASHNIPCPVCFDAPAMMMRDVTPGKYRQEVQPCKSCREKGYAIVRLPKFIRRFLWRN